MNRREVLLSSGIVLSTGLAGCSSDEAVDEPGEGNGNEGGDGDENGEVTISWNAAVFDAMSHPDDDGQYTSDDGEQYLVLAKEIENTGDEETSFATGELDVVTAEEEAEWTAIANASGMNENIPAGESAKGLSAFTIIERADTVSITASPTLESYAATFEHADSLELPFGPIDSN